MNNSSIPPLSWHNHHTVSIINLHAHGMGEARLNHTSFDDENMFQHFYRTYLWVLMSVREAIFELLAYMPQKRFMRFARKLFEHKSLLTGKLRHFRPLSFTIMGYLNVILSWFKSTFLPFPASKLDFSDGQFLKAMRCRCFFYNNDAMSMFLANSYHRNQCDYFCSTIRTDCFPMFFFQFATNCAYVRALVVKRRKIHSNWTKTLE